jgi:hypothetical protein
VIVAGPTAYRVVPGAAGKLIVVLAAVDDVVAMPLDHDAYEAIVLVPHQRCVDRVVARFVNTFQRAPISAHTMPMTLRPWQLHSTLKRDEVRFDHILRLPSS